MKNTFFLWFYLLFSILVFGQERKLIKGQLLYKNTKVVAANVVNNTSQTNTITDSEGEFEIEVAEGDNIIFSSVQYQIRAVKITSEILKKNRLVVTVNENINELKEVIVTTEDVEKFLDLKEEEFMGFDYDTDKSSRLENKAVRDRVISNGIDFVNIAKLIAKAFSNKTVEEQLKMKPSEILPLVFDDRFFENDLDLPQDQVMGFLIFIDKNMKTSSLLKQDMQFQLIDYLINRSKEFKNGQVN
ncbi:MAG: carboxypeptidase-like regulatory domain-containing protein [Flavobacteriaceae bacterium]|nr:carboxypeptidase-like regulatory domain-containing protein [Flavobacteriaceae bacterium]